MPPFVNSRYVSRFPIPPRYTNRMMSMVSSLRVLWLANELAHAFPPTRRADKGPAGAPGPAQRAGVGDTRRSRNTAGRLGIPVGDGRPMSRPGQGHPLHDGNRRSPELVSVSNRAGSRPAARTVRSAGCIT